MSPSERAAVDQAHRQFGEPTATPKPRAGEHTKVGQKVMCNGFPGAVVEICTGQLAGMAVVRLERGDVCISIGDLKTHE